MAGRIVRVAQRLFRFCKLVVLILCLGLFVQNSISLTSYTRQELLDIRFQPSDSFISNLHFLPELRRSPDTPRTAKPTGSSRMRRRDRKQRRGKHGGLGAKLMLTLHRLSLPSIVLANVRSLANKMDKLRLWITSSKRIVDCNVTIFKRQGIVYLCPQGLVHRLCHC